MAIPSSPCATFHSPLVLRLKSSTSYSKFLPSGRALSTGQKLPQRHVLRSGASAEHLEARKSEGSHSTRSAAPWVPSEAANRAMSVK